MKENLDKQLDETKSLARISKIFIVPICIITKQINNVFNNFKLELIKSKNKEQVFDFVCIAYIWQFLFYVFAILFKLN